jgi:hypothetical protein
LSGNNQSQRNSTNSKIISGGTVDSNQTFDTLFF